MSKKKAGGSTSLGRDSQGQRRGVKRYGSEVVTIGNIIVRQCGTKFHAGTNVKRTKDDTLIALANGIVNFSTAKRRRFDGSLRNITKVNVIPKET